MSSGNALMPTARVVAGEETAEFPVAAAQVASRDPLETLVDRVRPVAARSADVLQLAACLESSGITDRVARVRYGFTDVFELASQIRRRVAPFTDPYPDLADGRGGAWRDVGHGAIYLMPAMIFPAAMSVIGGTSALLTCLVLTAATGWVLSGVVAAAAYRLLGNSDPLAANRLLWWSALLATPLGAVVAGGAAAVTGARPAVMLAAAVAMAYQMAVTILVIRRREWLVLAAITPALLAGTAFLATGPQLRPVALVVGLASVGATYALALRETAHRPGAAARLLTALRPHRLALVAVFAYTALSATFFLYPQLPFLTGRLDVAVAMLPLIAGMGVVEWRAHRFSRDARALLGRVTHPRQFAARIWLVVLNGLCICFAVVGALAVALLGVLAAVARYTEPAATMAAAGVLLAGAYFLGYLLANLGRYGWLCVSLVLGLATYEVSRLALPGVLGDTHAFRIAAATLLLLNLVGLISVLGDARRHR